MTQPSEEEVRVWLEAHAEKLDAESRAYRVDTPFGDERECYEVAAIYRAALALLDAGRKDKERLAEVREFVELLDWLQEQNGGNLFTPIGMDPRTSGWAWFGPGGKAGTIAVTRDTIIGVLRAVKERSDET